MFFDGSPNVAVPSVCPGTAFTARALGDLDGDGQSSTFEVRVSANRNAIVDGYQQIIATDPLE